MHTDRQRWTDRDRDREKGKGGELGLLQMCGSPGGIACLVAANTQRELACLVRGDRGTCQQTDFVGKDSLGSRWLMNLSLLSPLTYSLSLPLSSPDMNHESLVRNLVSHATVLGNASHQDSFDTCQNHQSDVLNHCNKKVLHSPEGTTESWQFNTN